jgi:rhodanese-related sulfurtransferase
MAEAERQLALERAQRRLVAALSLLAGVCLFAGELWATVTESKDPTIGLLQGLAPAIQGKAAALVDPRTAHEQFLVHHQSTLIFALVVSALGAIAMIFPLRYLAAAERLRSQTPTAVTRYLAIFGPLMLAIFVPAYEISLIIGAHNYLNGKVYTAAALTAATGGSGRTVLVVLATVGQLAVAATFVLISLRAMRVGLLTRMMGAIGIIGGVLFLIPLTPLPVVQALWLVFLGGMLLEFGGRPLPEAWSVAEARPWPSQPRPERRPARQGRVSSRTASSPPPPPAPEPVVQRGPSPSASKKRKRRR